VSGFKITGTFFTDNIVMTYKVGLDKKKNAVK
jgi:hypothetical protein